MCSLAKIRRVYEEPRGKHFCRTWTRGCAYRAYPADLPRCASIQTKRYNHPRGSFLLTPELTSKVAVITGSSRGIGRAVALKLSELGATVVVNGHKDPSLVQSLAAEIQAKGGQALGIVADISQAQGCSQLIQSTLSQFGRLDIMVNNAGIVRDQLLIRMSDDEWDQVINTNLRGAFLCTRAAIRPMLKQRWGRIINIASISGMIGNPGQTNYAAAKAGLIAFTKSLAREVASRGITANSIAPGFIQTEMTQRLSASAQEEIIKQIPLGFIGSPEDVAEVAAFLASEKARYITGQVLVVDGGLTMV